VCVLTRHDAAAALLLCLFTHPPPATYYTINLTSST
jgi:hypothetical protein